MRWIALLVIITLVWACSEKLAKPYPAIEATFQDRLNLNELDNYADQFIPSYINKDNTTNNPISNAGASLGRVLFYDKNLSTDQSIACASCHKQSNAFGDFEIQSPGVDGFPKRHTMRLVNARFSNEAKFFWDERAITLEEQVTQPIQDHAEMGYSGQNGDPGMEDLIQRLEGISYYDELFTFVFGDNQITEERMQIALAQFIRSIQSFDSRYDRGLQMVIDPLAAFPNFSALENLGKELFLTPLTIDGAGCMVCHGQPEFSIASGSLNNGVIGIIDDPKGIDLDNTRAPSLRDIFNPNGDLNGPLMHDGSMTMEEVIEHYNFIELDPMNPNLDTRLSQEGNGQDLQLTAMEKQALLAFIKTLSGDAIYSDAKWSNPF